MRKYFEGIRDPRQAWKVEHDLLEIVIMTICAVISGLDHWEEIADFCRAKETWFNTLVRAVTGPSEGNEGLSNTPIRFAVRPTAVLAAGTYSTTITITATLNGVDSMATRLMQQFTDGTVTQWHPARP